MFVGGSFVVFCFIVVVLLWFYSDLTQKMALFGLSIVVFKLFVLLYF